MWSLLTYIHPNFSITDVVITDLYPPNFSITDVVITDLYPPKPQHHGCGHYSPISTPTSPSRLWSLRTYNLCTPISASRLWSLQTYIQFKQQRCFKSVVVKTWRCRTRDLIVTDSSYLVLESAKHRKTESSTSMNACHALF